nr:NADH dehydrogenase subunit 2 [Microheliella maris]
MHFLNFFENDFSAVLPELFFATSLTILLVYGVIYSTSPTYNKPILIQNIGFLGGLVTLITLLLVINNPFNSTVIFNNLLIIDKYSNFLKILILVSTLIILILSFDYVNQEKITAFEYILLILFSVLGILLLVSSYDFIALYLAIELQSLCLYVLAAFKKNSEFSTEAGLKYFVLGAFSSGLLLFGISLLYGFTGTTNFEDLLKIFLSLDWYLHDIPFGIALGVIFISAGIFFKLSAVPFHMWVPDVYEGAPTPVTAFFAIVPKLGIFGLAIRIFLEVFHEIAYNWQNLFLLCSIASIFIGVLGALYQRKIKRLIAYSAISHVGYLLLGLSAGTIESIQAIFFYLLIYILMTVGLFTIILSLNNDIFKRPRYITDFSGLSKTYPSLALTFAIILFSLAGIPPLGGFFSKMFLFFSAMEASLYGPAILAIILSVLGCFYYIRLIKIMYFEKPTNLLIEWKPISYFKSLILAIITFILIFLIIYPEPLYLFAKQIALSFYLY